MLNLIWLFCASGYCEVHRLNNFGIPPVNKLHKKQYLIHYDKGINYFYFIITISLSSMEGD